eukprot:CAMPEP_0168320714 /NCGR_PEP_ID=MMETSP0213-20121227/1842_1 /TAXON_ID=151035 /ORGANISM="Euplotes harpa, Strain FSP1.4" /LENGTH=67 /DNA_ID=CAMNT_0008322231 /DNA_START=142 /DNA_END=345 /DNA_ORIENTATION=-
MILQSELKDRLELEKEASGIMSNLTFINPPKPILKELYNLCTEMINTFDQADKKSTFKKIINFVNIN